MRGARSLLLLAILAIAGFVAFTYLSQRRVIRASSPIAPDALSPLLSGSAEDWQWSKSQDGRTIVDIRAKNFRQLKDASRFELEGVRLRIFHKEGDQFDLVTSARAEFRQAEGVLYSDGDVEITLGVPAEGASKHRLVSIQSTGITFDSKTGRASTDRAASFVFENGNGKATGASYDPSTRELRMLSQVLLNWKSPKPGAKPMKIEAGELLYREPAAAVVLTPWARLTREASIIEGAETLVTLEDGAVRRVDAKNGKGSDTEPKRSVEYSADRLLVEFSGSGEVESVTGEPNAHLTSRSDSAVTTVGSRRVDLAFDDSNALKTVHAAGGSVIESKPLGAQPLPPARILKSEVVSLKMRPGGKEIESVETESKGRLEFLPSRADQPRRELDGDKMWIAYGPGNRIQSFRSVNVVTRTFPPPAPAGRPQPSESSTSSVHLDASFDASGQIQRMEQRENFTYREGARRAKAGRGLLESGANRITLENAARMWDDAGSTAADLILLDQRTGNFDARGHVASSRSPEKPGKPDGGKAAGLLDGEEPVQATADRMTSRENNTLIHYIGNAVLWQGGNRIKADEVEVDRKNRRLAAHRRVFTELEDNRAGAKTRSFTTVRAGEMTYTDAARLAHYSGGAVLNSPGIQVKAASIRAYLAEADSESRLEKAFADTGVVIDQEAPGRARKGTSEHAEYYVDEEKVILRGGDPTLVDSLRGRTRGTELTWFSGDDRLLVNGLPEQRANSKLLRRK